MSAELEPARSVQDDLHHRRDIKLMAQIAQGNNKAFAALFDSYGSSALALSNRLTGNQSIGEEVVQEVFTQIWKRPTAYDSSRASVRAWIMMQIHHRSVDAVRHEHALRQRTTSVLQTPTPPDHPEDIVEHAWVTHRRQQVVTALAQLPIEQREVLELAYFSGLSQVEVAQKLGCPVGTVKSRTFAGMKKMREHLTKGAL